MDGLAYEQELSWIRSNLIQLGNINQESILKV